MTSLFGDDAGNSEPPAEMSKAAFAAEIGVSKPRISQLVKQGLPLTPGGKVPRADALAWYRAKIDPNRRKAFTEKPKGDSRSQLDALKVERERLALSKDRGELIDRRAARKAIFERARFERDSWTGWATRISPLLASELDVEPSAVYAALDREIRAQLAELAGTPFEGLRND